MSLALACLACAGFPPPAAPDGAANRAACQAYVGAYNALPCLDHDLDPGPICPPSLESAPCDLTPYWACQTAGLACRDGLPDLSAQAACGALRCP